MLSKLTTASVLSKAREAKHADEQMGTALLGEIGEDFTDHEGELKTVAGETRCQRHIRMIRVQIDDKVALG
jgi:hypothetical protein